MKSENRVTNRENGLRGSRRPPACSEVTIAGRVQQRLHAGGQKDDCSSEQSPPSRSLALNQPHPDRVENRLEQEDQRRLEGRDMLQGDRQAGVCEPDLKDPEVHDDEPVARVRSSDGKGPPET